MRASSRINKPQWGFRKALQISAPLQDYLLAGAVDSPLDLGGRPSLSPQVSWLRVWSCRLAFFPRFPETSGTLVANSPLRWPREAKRGYAAPKAPYPASFRTDLGGILSERRIRHQYPSGLN